MDVFSLWCDDWKISTLECQVSEDYEEAAQVTWRCGCVFLLPETGQLLEKSARSCQKRVVFLLILAGDFQPSKIRHALE